MLDTSVAVLLRDGDDAIEARVRELPEPLLMSIMTRIELEGGAVADPRRRPRLDALLASLPTMVFDDAAADQYRTIIEAAGFSKRKITDRMIAAQALARDATLVTLNGRDFQEIPNLKLLAW